MSGEIAVLLERVARATYWGRGAGQLVPVQWSALRYFNAVESDRRTVRALAAYLGITRGSASRTTASLVKRGLLSVQENPGDRRVPIFNVTDDGREALGSDPLIRLAEAIGDLEHPHRDALADGLKQLLGGLPQASPCAPIA